MSVLGWENSPSLFLQFSKYIQKLLNPPKPKKAANTGPIVPEQNRSFTWDRFNITIEDIKMSWYLGQNSSQKESLYHPRIQFVVRNDREEEIDSLEIELLYVEEGNKIFGDDHTYVRNLPSGYTSKIIFMKPGMGLIYNGYNRERITNQTYKVDMYAEYKGTREKITTLEFSSKFTN
jgi:hypothetical protein